VVRKKEDENAINNKEKKNPQIDLSKYNMERSLRRTTEKFNDNGLLE
jgi:hypothetical protein